MSRLMSLVNTLKAEVRVTVAGTRGALLEKDARD